MMTRYPVLLVAFVLFIIVRNMNKLMEAKAEEATTPDAPPEPTAPAEPVRAAPRPFQERVGDLAIFN